MVAQTVAPAAADSDKQKVESPWGESENARGDKMASSVALAKDSQAKAKTEEVARIPYVI